MSAEPGKGYYENVHTDEESVVTDATTATESSNVDSPDSKSRARSLGLCAGTFCCCLPALFVLSLPLMNSFVRGQIDTYGDNALGVPTVIQSLHLGVFNGKSSIDGVSIASPQGGNFVSLRDASIDVSYWSVFWEHLYAKSMSMNNISVTINSLPDGEANVAHIMAHLSNYIQEHKAPIGAQVGSYISKRLIVIDKLVITGIQFTVDLPMVSMGQGPVPFRIESIVITDIGKGEQGVRLSDLFAILLQALLNSLLQAVPQEYSAFMSQKLHVGVLQVFDYGQVEADVGQGLVRVGKGVGWMTNAISTATESAGEKMADAIEKSANRTEKALTKPIDSLMTRISPTYNGRQEKSFHKWMDKPFQGLRTWADGIENVTQKASNSVNATGARAKGMLQTAASGVVNS